MSLICIEDYGEGGVWAAPPHTIKALRDFANAFALARAAAAWLKAIHMLRCG